jgi:hypothetical protein
MEGPHFLDQPVVQLAVTCIIGDGEAELVRWPPVGTQTNF